MKYRERIYQGNLSEFIRDDLLGIHKIVRFLNLWMDDGGKLEKFYSVSYESLHRDTEESMSGILEFLGTDIDYSSLREAIEDSSFSKLKKLEKNGNIGEPWIKPGFGNDEQSMKIRKGKVGSYREELSETDVEYLDSVIRTHLTSNLPYKN